MNLSYRKNLLLLGAGFTKNFGGFVAGEMWAKIFSDPALDELPEIKRLFKDERNKFDFENIFNIVMRGDGHSDNDRNKFEKIIVETYISMQHIINHGKKRIHDSYAVNQESLQDFLHLFLCTDQEVGACFTLNQDLFFERKFVWQPFISKNKWFSEQRLETCGGYKSNYLDTDPHVLPTEAQLNQFSGNELAGEIDKIRKQHNILYFKLHGSLGWVAHDSSSRMIIGKNKAKDINSEPLLKLYFDEFSRALNQQGVKLLVIGYSFNDTHINSCIVKAINENNLKLYVVTTETPEDFQKRITHKYLYSPGTLNQIDNDGVKIWNAVNGYFPYKLSEIFPKDGSESDVAKTLKKIITKV